MTNWIQLMGWGARGVLIILLLLSIWSVGIMIDRRRIFRNEIGKADANEAKKMIQNKNWDLLKSWAENSPSFVGGVVLAALDAGAGSQKTESDSVDAKVDRAVQSYLADRKLHLEKGLNVLATLAANAAFIGLLGTVMGIIQSFGILSSAQGSAMNSVMFGLAEALVATAVGIFVAVPAAIAYNFFSQRLRTLSLEAQALRDLYISKR